MLRFSLSVLASVCPTIHSTRQTKSGQQPGYGAVKAQSVSMKQVHEMTILKFVQLLTGTLRTADQSLHHWIVPDFVEP